MRAAHISFQFDKSIVGGAEIHMYMLSKELLKKGIDIDIITTKNNKIIHNYPYVVSWKNTLNTSRDNQEGLKVLRFNTVTIPRIIECGLSFCISHQFEKETRIKHLTNFELPHNNSINGILGGGWHYLESIDSQLPAVRWTKKEAEFLLINENVSKVGFVAYCPKQIEGVLLTNNEIIGEFELRKQEWNNISFSTLGEVKNNIPCKIKLGYTWKPERDNRRLGILIKDIYYESNAREVKLNLEHDVDYFIKNSSYNFAFNLWSKMATIRPRIYDYFHMMAKGPISIDLAKFLRSNAKDYDILLANMIPFNTINYAMTAANRAKIPIILLPHFHMNDKTHYWRYFLDAFKKADAILALTEITKNLLEPINSNVEVVGAGIDIDEFSNPSISGNRFRLKYHIEDSFMVLFIGRKTPYKRYDMAVSAINILKCNGFDIKLVMIGPDEDKRIMESEDILYLGEVNRSTVLDAYDACDVFVMPSEYESFGLVFCEAWSRKKPVIGNRRCGPVSCLIDHERDGFLCNDDKELSDYLAKLIDDGDLGKKMGKNGYQKVINNYTWNVVAERVKKIYEKLL